MTNERFTEKEKAFLLDLELISRKHGVFVDGCGCCGSPSLLGSDEFSLDERSGYGDGGVSDFAWICYEGYDWEQGRRPVKDLEESK